MNRIDNVNGKRAHKVKREEITEKSSSRLFSLFRNKSEVTAQTLSSKTRFLAEIAHQKKVKVEYTFADGSHIEVDGRSFSSVDDFGIPSWAL